MKPLPDELLSSWILRYSKCLKTKSHTFCKFVLKSENVWNRDIDLNVTDKFLDGLSDISFVSREGVYNTTLKSYYPNLFVHTSRKWILPIRIYHRIRKSAGQMFCPGCLKKDHVPYFRRKWRLSLSVVCPDCKIVLLDKCPNCSSPISFHRLEVGLKEGIIETELSICYECSFDLRKSPKVKARKSIVDLQRKFYSAINDGFTEYTQYSHLFFDCIHQLVKIINSKGKKFSAFDKELSKLAGIEFKKVKSRGEFDKLGLEDRYLVLQKIDWILKKWPQRFIHVALKTHVFSSDLLKDMKHPPYWYWKIVMENTNVIFTSWRDNEPSLAYLPSYSKLFEKKSKS